MTEKIKKHQETLVIILIVICIGAIMIGGVNHIWKLRRNLKDNGIQNLMTVTVQQQQAFDSFIAEDREQVQSFADFFAGTEVGPEEIQQLLKLSNDPDAIYLVMCLDEGWICGTSFEDVRQLDEENLDLYRSLTEGGGVRDSYTGLYSGTSRFGYYETFTFRDGDKGLIQKSYDRSKIYETFSLSFYNDKGFTYIVNQQGNILLWPADKGEISSDNIFDMLTAEQGLPKDIDFLKDELKNHRAGSMTISGDGGELAYTYVPSQVVEGWYLISVVPGEDIAEESNQILLDFQMSLGLLILVLFICALFILLIWRTQRDLIAKDREIVYQMQLFDIFATYLANNTNDVYMMLDHETEEFEYISPNVERVMGVKAEGFKQYMWDSDFAMNSEGTRIYYDELNAMVPGDVKTRNVERVNPKTGEHRFFVENGYCVEIQGRRKRVSYISDRTEEQKIQDSLNEALQMARIASEAKSAFLSNVSHDIRTPMNAIIGFLALMRNEVNNPDAVMEYNKRIDAASQHLLGLINDVLDMNKIESGSTTLNISEMNLAEVIDEINNIIRPQTKAKNQTFEINASHLNYEHVLGDKLRLNQILINLMSNAVKYTPENGDIQLQVEELPQVLPDYTRIRFTVRDSGMGMSEDYLKVIFDPFTRDDAAVTNQIQGTGLGMAITKSLVDLMGGTIRVESEQGKGSTFVVELELRIDDQSREPEFWNEHGVTRMIVTDDEEEVCRNIVKTMSSTGVEVDYATSGEKLIEIMRANREAGNPYDLILLDWKMPDLNGLETARLIRQKYSQKIPILLLTAYDWSDIEEEAREIGVNHFMPKPFFLSSFKEAIRRVTGAGKEQEESIHNFIQGMHIMVVDDIVANRMILVKILSTLGADSEVATNGKEAVEKFEASRPGEYDMILMDVQMPVMDGYTATRTIRTSRHPSAKTIPIIAMTANAFVDDVRDALEAGMDAHVAKPIQIDKLKETIQQVMESRAK